MQVCHDHVVASSITFPLDLCPPLREGSRPNAMTRLDSILSPRQRLDLVCAIIAAELGLSTVAVLRREPDGALSRIAGADAPAGRGQVHDHRSVDGVFIAPPSDSDPAQEVACWTFADRGRTDLLIFAGLHLLDGRDQWAEWARRLASMVLGMSIDGLRPTAMLAGSVDAHPSRAAAAAWRARTHFSDLELKEGEIADDENNDEEVRIRVSLEGLESLEPLGEAGWRRILDYCTARIVAIAGQEHVAVLGDGEYEVSLSGESAITAQVLDAIKRALLSPVPGVGPLPALRVRTRLA